MNRATLASVLEFVVPAALIVLWWLASADSTSFYFPPLRDILKTFWENWISTRLGKDLLPSVTRLLCGFGIAVAVGVTAGMVLGMQRTLGDMFAVVLDFLRSMPSVALIPFAILVFGIGAGMKVFIIAFGAVWPILLNTIDGVRGVDAQMHDVGRAFKLRRRDQWLRIVLPAAAPQIFTGMRASLSISVIMMVVSEMLASTDGIGFAVLQAQRSFAIQEMWAGLLVLGLLGYVLNLIFVLIERRALHWHRGMRLVSTRA